MKINCVAIDDEPLALQQMLDYIKRTPFLEPVGGYYSAYEAMETMEGNPVQLLFIDINMPDLSGLDFVKSLKDKPHVVFTTAHSEYAVEGFKVDAVDYLLKPIDYASFLKAANKVKNLIELSEEKQSHEIRTTENHLFVKSEYKLIRIELSEIKYIEGMHEYVKIHLINDKPVITLLSLKAIEEKLPADKFMRVHRSYIVNLDRIKIIERDRIIFDGKVYIPVSDQYKNKFHEYLDKNFLSN